jgi:hypothetical protein
MIHEHYDQQTDADTRRRAGQDVRGRGEGGAMTPQPDAAKVSKLILDLARWQVDTQLTTADNYDSKSTAMLGLVGVALGLVLTFKGALGSGWWVSALVLLAAAACALLAIRDRAYHYGPEPEQFYNEYGGLDEAEANVKLLSHLLPSLAANDTAIKWKSRCFMGSITLLVFAGGVAVVELMVR